MWPFKRRERSDQQEPRKPIDALIQQSQYGTSFDFENTPGLWVEYDFPFTTLRRLRLYCAGNLPLRRFEHWKDEPGYMPREEYQQYQLRLLQVLQPDATIADIEGEGLDLYRIRIHKDYIGISRRVYETPNIHTTEVVNQFLPIVQGLAGWESLPEVVFGPPPNAGKRWSAGS